MQAKEGKDVMVRGSGKAVSRDLGKSTKAVSRDSWGVDAKTGRLRLHDLRPHRTGQALVHAFLKRQPYIMRP